MAINPTYRLIKGSPLTWSEMDENFRQIADQAVTQEALALPEASASIGYQPTGGGTPTTVKEALDQSYQLTQQIGIRVDHAILSYSDYPSAEAAAATLPDGQVVDVESEQKRYRVDGGAMVFEKNLLRRDMADPTGASLVGFSHAETYAVGTVGAKLKKWVSVTDAPYNADQTGVADSTAAIQAAIDAVSVTGGAVYFPPGNYKLTTALNIPTASVSLLGFSRYATTLTQHTLSAKIVNSTGIFFNLAGLALTYNGTPTSGATAIYCSGSYPSLNDFVIRSAHIGIHLQTGVAQKITNFEIFDYEYVGLLAQGLNDAFVSKFIINAGNTTRGALGGIRLVDKVEAFLCTDGDVLLGAYSMTTAAGSYTMDTRPAYNSFTNVYFDSSVSGVSLGELVETEFVGCWFSGGRAGGGNPGCTVNQCDSLTFTNSRFFNCGGNGCAVTDLAKRTHFIGCKFESNSVTSGAGVAHGLFFANNTTDFLVQGCVAHNGLYTGTQASGIFIGSGCDYFNVSDNNVSGNATGGILDGSSATADKKIGGNIGYRTTNTGAATILAGTTTIIVTHGLAVTPRQQDITLTRGSGNQGSTDLMAGSITSTQFTITTAAAPSGDMVVNWTARCAGA